MDNQKRFGVALSEKQIQISILKYLQLRGIYCWRNNTTGVWDPTKQVFRKLGFGSIRGVADILGILPGGKLLAIEVKSAKGKVSHQQHAFLTQIRERQGIAIVARKTEEVASVIEAYFTALSERSKPRKAEPVIKPFGLEQRLKSIDELDSASEKRFSQDPASNKQ